MLRLAEADRRQPPPSTGRNLSNILFTCLMLQQFGPNYHLSIGCLGLAIMLVGLRFELVKLDVLPIVGCAAMIIAGSLSAFIRYGLSPEYARLTRYIFCAASLLFLLRINVKLPAPSALLMLLATIGIVAVVLYQIFFDRMFQVPREWFALGENLGILDNADHYSVLADSIRSNGIYSEPSYLGMILTCIALISSAERTTFNNITSFIACAGLLISGSGVGLAGLLLVVGIGLQNTAGKITPAAIAAIFGMAFALLFTAYSIIFQGYEIAAFSRFSDGGIVTDASSGARIFSPLLIVYENIRNFNILGIPTQAFEHFRYTGLYNDIPEAPFHNGILNLIIFFGVTGLFLMREVVRASYSSAYLAAALIIGSQNGNFLSYEKVFSIVLMLYMLRHSNPIIKV